MFRSKGKKPSKKVKKTPYDYDHPTVQYAQQKYGLDPYALFNLMNKQLAEFKATIGEFNICSIKK